MVRKANFHERIFADKTLCKEYINDTLGTDTFTPATLGTFESASQIDFEKLPVEYVIKGNHLSGGSIISWRDAPQDSRWSNSPYSRNVIGAGEINVPKVTKFLQEVLKEGNSRKFFPEISYSSASKTLLLEELFHDKEEKSLPNDVKFFMFGGEAKLIRYHSIENYAELIKSIDEFDINWMHLPNEFEEPGKIFKNSSNTPTRPCYFEEMLCVAEKLSSNIDFVRVDFLGTSSEFRVGEMTSYPTAGLGRWKDSRIDNFLGSLFSKSIKEN
jgi:hypothetical protein